MKKQTKKQKQLQQKRRLIRLAVALVIVCIGAGAYFYMHKNNQVSNVSATAGKSSQAESDAVFRRYLTKYINATSVHSVDTYSGTGSQMTAKTAIDVTNKQLIGLVDLNCSARVSGTEVTLKASVQQENTVLYMRLNDIAGTITGTDGQVSYLSDAYSKVKGNWYKESEADIAVQSQLDSGVYIYDSGIIAPKHDAQQIVNYLLNNRAFTYTLVKRDGANYVYSFRASQNDYLTTIKSLFPELNSPDEIIDNLFAASGSLDSTLTIAQDGTLVKQETTHDNLCRTVMAGFTGTDPANIDAPSIITGTSVPKPASSFVITPIANSKPTDGIKKDLLY